MLGDEDGMTTKESVVVSGNEIVAMSTKEVSSKIRMRALSKFDKLLFASAFTEVSTMFLTLTEWTASEPKVPAVFALMALSILIGVRNAPTGISLVESIGKGGMRSLIAGIFTVNEGNSFSLMFLQLHVNARKIPSRSNQFLRIQ